MATQLPTVQSRLAVPHQTVKCVHCATQLEYLSPSPPADTEPFQVRCAKPGCEKTWIVRPPRSRVGAGGAGGAVKRRIGTDEKPLDLTYYELLGLPPTCTTEDVKKAYRRLALKYHPDKNPDDPSAGEKFKDIAIAFATLSDPGLRHTYNEFGKAKQDGGDPEGAVDPEAIFSQLFGGESFKDIIGTISLGMDMKSALQEEEDTSPEAPPASGLVDEKGKPIYSPAELEAQASKKAAKDAVERKQAEEKARIREERVSKLVERLRNTLALFAEQAEGEDDVNTANGVRAIWTIKAEELKQESYGVELLNTVGFTYSSKSRHYLASTGPIPFGVGGWFHSARSTVHIVGETVSTVRSAYALKEVFEKLSAAEKSGLSDEKKKELEDKAAQMGLHALFKGAKLEVESVIREVCDRILAEDRPVPELRKRATAMGILGEVYEKVKKDAGDEGGNPLLGMGSGMGAAAGRAARKGEGK